MTDPYHQQPSPYPQPATRPEPRVHPLIAAPLVPFVMLRDAVVWLGRQLGRMFAAIGRFLWWLLYPVRWLCRWIWAGLCWLGRQIWKVLGPVVAFIVVVVVTPFVWVYEGLAWLCRWIWRGIGPALRAAWRAAERMARAVWRGLVLLGRAIYWPFRPIVRGIAACGRAVGRWYRSVRNSARAAVGLPPR